MAIYHCSIKTFSRAKGQTAVAAAAYRARTTFTNDMTGKVENYSRKPGLVHTEIVLPAHAPDWAHNPSQLWNEVEKKETRKNATVAREFEIALPHELNEEQRQALAHSISQKLVDRFGFALQYSIHKPDEPGSLNHHVHILASTRKLEADGFTTKTRDLDNLKGNTVPEVREMVADTINQHLAAAGIKETVSHKSLADQKADALAAGDVEKAAKLDRTPTVHVGKNPVSAKDRGTRNAGIKAGNIQKLQSFVQLLERNPQQQIKLDKPQHSTFSIQPLKVAASSGATAGADARPAQPILDTGSSTLQEDASIAELEHQIGNLEAQIATLKLRPGKAADLLIRKKSALKEKLEGQLRLAHAKRAEKKSASKSNATWSPSFKTADQYFQQKQPQQSPEKEQRDKTEQQRKQEEARKLRRQADELREAARVAGGPAAAELNSRAWNLEGKAERLEQEAKPKEKGPTNDVGRAFRPPGF